MLDIAAGRLKSVTSKTGSSKMSSLFEVDLILKMLIAFLVPDPRSPIPDLRSPT